VPSLRIEQIAALAGVSRSTVSRVLNNHPSVRPEVRERIYRVIDEQGYTPRAAARSLARRQTNLIGVIMPDGPAFIFSTLYFSNNLDGITKVCVERGYYPMVSMFTPDVNPDIVEHVMRSRHFDGVIVYEGDTTAPILELLFEQHIPVVRLGPYPHHPGLSGVEVTDREGAYEATQHLIKLGHRRIGLIAGPQRWTVAKLRQAGYEQALQDAGLAVLPDLIVEGDHMQEGGYSGMMRLLALGDRPSAVFASNDPMAFGALQALDKAGLSVPDDVALVGFDDLPAASSTRPPLSTVRQPMVDLGAAAATLLIDQLDHKLTEPVQIRLPTQLIVRGSCGASSQAAIPGAVESGASHARATIPVVPLPAPAAVSI
jgi:DNA-binding LacI/PurR family transcriptional regulator